METPEQDNAETELVPIGAPNLRDVPASLRRLADQLESGEQPAAEAAIVVLVEASKNLQVYPMGSALSDAAVVGTLHFASMAYYG